MPSVSAGRMMLIAGASPAHGHERSEVVYYNLGKFSQVISDYEQIYFKSDPGWKYESFRRFLVNQAESIYPEGWVDAKYATPNAVQVLTIGATGITHVVSFNQPELFAAFGLPMTLSAAPDPAVSRNPDR